MDNRINVKHRNRIVIASVVIAVLSGGFWFFQRNATKPVKERRDFVTEVPVSVSVVSKASVRDSFSVVGVSEAFRDVGIYSETSGIVRAVSCEVGQKKSAGDVLIKVDDVVLASALRKARINQELAKRDWQRYQNLQQEGAVSVSSYETKRLRLADAGADLVAAERRLSDTSIKAPIKGIVTSRAVDVGELVQPGMKVAEMVDLSKIKIKSAVPEKLVSRLSEGMPVDVTTDIHPGSVFHAVVSTITGKASRDHTYQVEVIMDNPAAFPFRAGMFARTAFVGRSVREALLIPRQALVGSIINPEVYVVRKGSVRLQKIVAGQELQNSIEVLDGLVQGDVVVTGGQNELSDRTKVKVIRQESGAGR
jgi:RND family efflux transporter MFP subunit